MSTKLIIMVLGSKIEFTDRLPFSILGTSIPHFYLFVNTLAQILRYLKRKARSWLFHHLNLLWLFDDDLWRALVFLD